MGKAVGIEMEVVKGEGEFMLAVAKKPLIFVVEVEQAAHGHHVELPAFVAAAKEVGGGLPILDGKT